jgi:hypothetical protein
MVCSFCALVERSQTAVHSVLNDHVGHLFSAIEEDASMQLLRTCRAVVDSRGTVIVQQSCRSAVPSASRRCIKELVAPFVATTTALDFATIQARAPTPAYYARRWADAAACELRCSVTKHLNHSMSPFSTPQG